MSKNDTQIIQRIADRRGINYIFYALIKHHLKIYKSSKHTEYFRKLFGTSAVVLGRVLKFYNKSLREFDKNWYARYHK